MAFELVRLAGAFGRGTYGVTLNDTKERGHHHGSGGTEGAFVRAHHPASAECVPLNARVVSSTQLRGSVQPSCVSPSPKARAAHAGGLSRSARYTRSWKRHALRAWVLAIAIACAAASAASTQDGTGDSTVDPGANVPTRRRTTVASFSGAGAFSALRVALWRQ